MSSRRNAAGNFVVPALAVVVLLCVWQLADFLFEFKAVIFPNPIEVAHALQSNLLNLAFNAAITFVEAFLGFVLAVIAGLALAAAAHFSNKLRQVIMPFTVSLKATPIIVLAPLLIMWIGNGYGSKIAMAAVAAFFPVLVNAFQGFTSIEREWLELMQLHGASKSQVFWELRVPHALPNIFSGMKIATSLAMVGAVVSEFSGAEVGIGKLIATSTYYLNIDLVFAGVLVLCLVGIGFYGFVAWLQNKVAFWKIKH